MKPIIFIPGIEATTLVDTNTFDYSNVWNAYDSLLTAAGTKLTGPHIDQKLQLDPIYDEKPEIIVERNHIARLPYEKSIVNIKTKVNEKNRIPDPVYLFGYDWRLSNVENAKKLHAFIQYLQLKLQNNTLDGFRFVTHSMGGLIFSCYLKLQTSFEHIDKVVLCAPPFLGSPYALIHMIKGDGGFKSFLNRVFGRDDDIRKVVRTYPSVFELLPAYTNALTYTDDQTALNLQNINHWQNNVYDDILELFQNRLQGLTTFRKNHLTNFDELPADLRQRMVIIAGSENDTIVHVKADKKKKDIENFLRLDLISQKTDETGKQVDRNGDGTVPFVSSTIFKESVRTLEVIKEDFFDELSNNIDYHGLFLRDSRVQNIIIRFFTSPSLAAKRSDGTLTKLTGKASNMWFSIGDSVINLSPF